jgi:hypothetical protein
MTLELRDYKGEEDFTEFKRWWEFWRWKDRVTQEILSDIGYVVEKDGLPLCAGFLYTTNSLIASIEWVVSNPFAQKEDVAEGLDFLLECLCQRALKEEKRLIMTTINSPTLAKRLEKLGFVMSGENLKQYIRLKWQ